MPVTYRDSIAYPEPAGPPQAELQMPGTALSASARPAASPAESWELKGAKCYASGVWHALDNCCGLLKGNISHGNDHKGRKRKH